MQVRVDMPAEDFVVGRFVANHPGASAALRLARTRAREGRFFLQWDTHLQGLPAGVLEVLLADLARHFGQDAVQRLGDGHFALAAPEDAVQSRQMRALVRFIEGAKQVTGHSQGRTATMWFAYASDAVAREAADRMRGLLAHVGPAQVTLEAPPIA